MGMEKDGKVASLRLANAKRESWHTSNGQKKVPQIAAPQKNMKTKILKPNCRNTTY